LAAFYPVGYKNEKAFTVGFIYQLGSMKLSKLFLNFKFVTMTDRLRGATKNFLLLP